MISDWKNMQNNGSYILCSAKKPSRFIGDNVGGMSHVGKHDSVGVYFCSYKQIKRKKCRGHVQRSIFDSVNRFFSLRIFPIVDGILSLSRNDNRPTSNLFLKFYLTWDVWNDVIKLVINLYTWFHFINTTQTELCSSEELNIHINLIRSKKLRLSLESWLLPKQIRRTNLVNKEEKKTRQHQL